MSKKRLGACILLVLLLGIISAIVGYMISDKIHSDSVAQSIQQSAHASITTPGSNSLKSSTSDSEQQTITDNTTSGSGISATYQSPIDFDTLQASNEDIYAWISIPDTSIDYPIAQHPTDDSYYLNHGADGIYSDYGCPYTETSDSSNFIEFNTVIYGHNMNNGSMFGSLHDYEDEDFFKEHRTIYIYTKDHTFTYTVFAAVMYSDAHIPYYYDDNIKEDRESFLKSLKTDNVKERSIYYEDMDVTADSKIVTLSTCDKKLRNNRFLVVAVMTQMDGRAISNN
ncbi:MAG: class B sortase [Butyrivibrio sp.]|uniref:class B sortase n=1 Tax=Butyrivibrio sp. TaxID=28121 RepID=UPI0025CFC7F5|nr:class B sortase [Butyrivibrio sp.]MCR5770197.1 class B sortase [Butyrivibrio sp.]